MLLMAWKFVSFICVLCGYRPLRQADLSFRGVLWCVCVCVCVCVCEREREREREREGESERERDLETSKPKQLESELGYCATEREKYKNFIKFTLRKLSVYW